MKIRKTLALLLVVALLSGAMLLHAFAQESRFTITAELTFGQTDARAMISLINDLRKPANAWYWAKDDKTKETANNLKDLTYDYGLEKIAMQRAAEIAVYYSHTRPNGESCFTAYDYDYRSIGENIAWGSGSRTVTAAVTQFVNEKQYYDYATNSCASGKMCRQCGIVGSSIRNF